MVNPNIIQFPHYSVIENKITVDDLIINNLYIVNDFLEVTDNKCIFLDKKPCASRILFHHSGPLETVELLFYSFEKNETFSIPRDELPFYHIRPL